MKTKFAFLKKHLTSHNGDGYIWFLFITMILLLIFGALVVSMTTSVNMRDIRDSVDHAASDVFAEVREINYENLTDGSTDNTFINFENHEVMEMMAEHLNAKYVNDAGGAYIYKVDTTGQLEYRIDLFQYTYIPNIQGELGGIDMKGDLNGDRFVDSDDIAAAREYFKSGEQSGIHLSRIDLNGDGIANNQDIVFLEGLVKYYETTPSNNDTTDSALLIITFQVTVPIKFGNINFGDSVDTYSYHSLLSFKSAN